jgi:23S rRNA pseudouridine1911/1915/1917 synthase
MINISDIEILYDDEDCVVVNKPAGLMVHSDGRAGGPFLTDWIIEKFPQAKGVGDPASGADGEPVDRSGIVHRLDRDTSGALIIAKTQKCHECLKKQFQDRIVKKHYLAFVWGEVKEEFGTIDRPIARSGSDFRKWSAQRGARGESREAETYWTRLWTGMVDGERISLLDAEPKTGRTHQIRVHFNAVNHPVICDTLYAPKRPPILGFNRLALHSSSVEFETTGGKCLKIKAPLPEDFQTACQTIDLSL